MPRLSLMVRACALVALALFLNAIPAPAANLASFHSFSIAAQPLGGALLQFSLATGIDVLVDDRIVQDHQSPGVQGQWRSDQALEQLLEGTGLQWHLNGNNLITLTTHRTADMELSVTPVTELQELQGVPLPVGLRPTEREQVVLAPVTVRGTREDDATFRAPASVNIITQKDIERFRGTSVGDIFQGTPGVLIGENRNSGGLDVNIRGMQGQGRVPVLIDGARQETTVYRGYAGVSSRSYVDPDLIGGIRIDKGPVMSAEGTGATGGTVSMRTIEAGDIIKPGKEWGIRLRGSLMGNNSGSVPAAGTPAGYHLGAINDDGVYRIDCARSDICEQQHYTGRSYALPDSFAPAEGMDRPSLFSPKSHAGSIALARRFDWGSLLVAYAERSQGNYYAGKHGPTPYMDLSDQRKLPFYTEVRPKREGATRFRAEERIVNSNYASESLLLKGQFHLPADQSLELSYLRYDSTYGELMPSQLMWFGTVRQTDSSTVLAETYNARYRWQPAELDWADILVSLWQTDTRSQNIFYYLEGDFSNNSATEMGSASAEHYQRRGADLSNTMHFWSYGQPVVAYGISLQHEDLSPTRISKGGQMGDDFSRDGLREELSAFTAVQWYMHPNVILDAGMRYTRFSTEDRKAAEVSNTSSLCVDSSGDGTCDPVYYESSSSGTTPIVSLTWEPRADIQLYARYAEAMRMPSLFETTQGFSVNPNMDTELKPEHAKNREVGLNVMREGMLTTNDTFRLKLAYFRNYTKDYLTRTSVNFWEESSTNSMEFFRMRNIDSASFHGVELNMDYDLGWLFTELAGTKYTHIEMCHHGSLRRYDCTDYGISNSYINNMIPPQWHASAILGVRLLSRKLELGTRGTFMGQRTMAEFHDDTSNGFTQPIPWHEYTLWDLFVSYQPNDWLTLDFNIDNLTDEYYLDALSLGLVPAPGRTARLSMTLHF